jgi:opacity protein-like surface antigen
MHKKIVVFITGLLLAALPFSAQAQEKRTLFSIGGGFTAPNSDVRDHLGDGYNFTIGLQVNVNPVFGIEGLYSFNGLGEKSRTINIADVPGGPTSPTELTGSMNMQYGTVSAIIQKPDGNVRPYGLVGMGVYYRPIEVSTPGVGWVPGYCDPFWYVCYPGGWVEVENVLGERSSTDFGMVFGGGVNFGAFFSELRYHYIWGPEVEELQATPPIQPPITLETRKANGQFLAVTFGFRF